MSSFLICKETYQQAYEMTFKAACRNEIYLYFGGKDLNKEIYKGFRNLQIENIKTVNDEVDENDLIQFKSFDIDKLKYFSTSTTEYELIQLFKVLRSINYQIETRYNKDFYHMLMVSISIAVISKTLEYGRAGWGEFKDI